MSSPFHFKRPEASASALFSRERLHPAALAALEISLERKQCWLVAFSGGADSLALLLTLWTLWPAQRSRLRVVHFNHAWRGEESDADEKFCALVCEQLGVAFQSARWENLLKAKSEESARDARFVFFKQVAKAENCGLLVTGHQQNDILETHLMRLARGASSTGLAAPRPVREWEKTRLIVRPLLVISAEEIRAALRSAGLAWREDGSNQSDLFLRNRLRRHVVPAWVQATGAQAREGAALTREWLEEDDVALESWLDELGIEKVVTKLALGGLRNKPRALLRRALRRWIYSAPLSRGGFEELMRLAQGDAGQLSIADGIARIEDGCLIWIAASAPPVSWKGVTLSLGASALFPDGACFTARKVEIDERIRARFRGRQIDLSKEVFVRLDEPIISLRAWQPGDRYEPLGLGGSSKVQDLFVNRKIEEPLRSRIPVVCGTDERVIWVPGLLPAEQCKITPDCREGVQLTYIAGTSTVKQQSLFL